MERSKTGHNFDIIFQREDIIEVLIKNYKTVYDGQYLITIKNELVKAAFANYERASQNSELWNELRGVMIIDQEKLKKNTNDL
jgi:hypothetical protein